MNISYFSKVYKNLHLFLIIYYLRLFYLFLFFKIIIVRRPPSAVRRPPSAVRRPPSASAVRIRRPDPHFTESLDLVTEPIATHEV